MDRSSPIRLRLTTKQGVVEVEVGTVEQAVELMRQLDALPVRERPREEQARATPAPPGITGVQPGSGGAMPMMSNVVEARGGAMLVAPSGFKVPSHWVPPGSSDATSTASASVASAFRQWVPRVLDRYLRTLSPAARNVLAVLVANFPQGLVAERLVDESELKGSQALGPVLAAIVRQADEIGCLSPIIEHGPMYGLHPTFHAAFLALMQLRQGTAGADPGVKPKT